MIYFLIFLALTIVAGLVMDFPRRREMFVESLARECVQRALAQGGRPSDLASNAVVWIELLNRFRLSRSIEKDVIRRIAQLVGEIRG